ncbi:YgfZ/GcvT domain-containing protein [Pseudomonas sp. 5P_3.1_Bac2]|uniref:CAF17-like 4Fe-4S cluster assembly/insertion protein YgfZ n=1 Tax=Pseudomonas sp. 5P_3.1_Bac2 TaxID=2971617 RepID=UPI0021C8FF1D|nr:folate-binding protein YgfZ [Pseudomonas sp. 5P_3.1_Bac2]MCU1715919.1 folate-binding protein YgfZ [Pseudomonas sp. 5P_3.1_Bac2]
MADSAFYCLLSHEGVLAVRGVDANKFLQGQVTCNLNYLSAERSSLGARCTPKGRMQSSFRIVSVDGGYLLAMASELLEPQLADLKKYAVFSKSTLSDESSQWLRIGLSGADQALRELGLTLPSEADSVAQHQQLLAVRLSDGRAELWLPAELADEVQAQLAQTLSQAPLNDWLLAQVRAGIGQVVGDTRELFIPQMINLQSLGGVSFKKGCYTGQEIVARMQYLGKLKRRLQRLSSTSSALPAAGTQLFSPVHSSSVGEVVLAAHSEQGIELLAVLQEDATQDGRVHLASADGEPLSVLDLPYAPNADEEIKH